MQRGLFYFVHCLIQYTLETLDFKRFNHTQKEQTATEPNNNSGLGIRSSVFQANRSFFVSERAQLQFARFFLANRTIARF